MLYLFKELFDKEELLSGRFGIEREALRVKADGKLAVTNHPEVFGDKLLNPYITTDFSESQVELITPAFKTTKEAYSFLNALYDIVVLEIGDEYLWPQSMPCDIPDDEHIPIAKYSDCGECKKAREYREKLFKKYGGKKQLISGIHYNFSFEETLFEKLYEHQKPHISYKSFKNNLYLKVARNYLRYRWLLIYLMGAAPIIHSSYSKECTKKLLPIKEDSFSNTGAISYRNGECGYKNHTDLYPDYTSLESYITSIEDFVKENMIQSHKELYTQIRPKAKDNRDLLHSLKEDGIQYIEIRSIDINPFEKGGISLEDLDFIHLFMLYLLLKEETYYLEWQQEALENQKLISKNGIEDIMFKMNGEEKSRVEWMLDLLEEMKNMNAVLELDKEVLIDKMMEKALQSSQIYAYQITEKAKKQGYLEAHIEWAKRYKQESYHNRYKLEGYEELELSTQILMKEAIKTGIHVDVLDRSDNFIAFRKGELIEYVKQATKTSKDSYITMLMMENKTVTKKILTKNGINVPKGIELSLGQSLELAAARYEGKPIVVKPKSTNFGTGISIFPEGASKEDIMRALEIGFKHDHTVLIEEFAKGKEYRFLVVGDQVVGILHRVPANVEGDGMHTIRELVTAKNQDPLRGKGYKTPLEKIELDNSSALFLKQKNIDFDYIPQISEVIYLRENSNISTGGDSIDYTDSIPVKFKDIAVRAAKAVEAKFCGVDMMLEEYENPESNYSIIEINFNPAIHIHSFPYKGKERNIARSVLEVLELI
ncbi:bifunctional glutamate--cysteine ligase GshA/glutathione synthetase GshB [Cellulosilyticum sp. I15G10I2]|uniref:bifunctional glutamate--cysteine ligase GshA/glutathione synthetase GshB n=1 Tax=Cellulosilyticum sp. I15G10I2 TaxID=1892843 RepID=UPI00085C897F|nr:bifunctional glutamate--cysteine ligase GshA/glutathione synthetase GshB [Cellulosilyticum sp. I15G10I2]